jgi:AcrR family transcriptional regulator
MSYRGGTTAISGASYGRLPRGRHGIPREVVTANQRERVLDAVTEIFAEQGYAALAIRNVIDRAGVSRATFYKIFEGKDDCVRAAQLRAYDGLQEAIVGACSSRQDWASGVAAAVGAALDFFSRSPAEALLLLGSSHAFSEPQLAREGLAIQQRLIELLRKGSESHPSTRSPSSFTERAAVGAALSIVGSCMAAGEVDALAALEADLVQIILTPFLGGNEAKRIAEVSKRGPAA